jgi:3-(methylthio)propionyl---CoA ligase
VPVATLAWKTASAIWNCTVASPAATVFRTPSTRLFPDQIRYIINHAEDRYNFFDPVPTPLMEQLAPHAP